MVMLAAGRAVVGQWLGSGGAAEGHRLDGASGGSPA